VLAQPFHLQERHKHPKVPPQYSSSTETFHHTSFPGVLNDQCSRTTELFCFFLILWLMKERVFSLYYIQLHMNAGKEIGKIFTQLQALKAEGGG
jgi:hypothetical protein